MKSEFDKIMERADHEMHRRNRREARHAKNTGTFWRLAIVVFASVMLVALVVDLRHLDRNSRVFRLTGSVPKQGDAADMSRALDAYAPPSSPSPSPRTTVPSGRASWMTPPGWRSVKPDPDTHFEVVLRGPDGLDMAVETYVTNNPSFSSLLEKIRQIERSWAGNFHISVAILGKNRAIKRSMQLYHSRVLMFDFATGDIGHHIQFSIPTALYTNYEAVCTRLIADTYEPGQILASPVIAP